MTRPQTRVIQERDMTVILSKKTSKNSLPSITKKEAKEMRKINPKPTKHKKELKRNEQLGEYNGYNKVMSILLPNLCPSEPHQDKDGDVILDTDAYNFDEHFT